MNAIVYTTNSGSTERYAKLLSRETGLPVYSLAEAKKKVLSDSEIIYLGWVMASTVKGYAKALKRYNVRAVCAVGMAKTGAQEDVVRKKNAVPESITVFTLQGNFDVEKLHGAYRLMMEIACKGLADKKDRTPEDDEMLDMMLSGDDRVSVQNLESVLEWYKMQK